MGPQEDKMPDTNQSRLIAVLVERENETIAPITYELLHAGRLLANKLQGSLAAILIGYEVENIAREVAPFVEQVYCLNHTLLRTFQVELYAAALEQLCKSIRPEIILTGHTLDNSDLAPRLACKLGTRLVTDCVHLDLDPQTNDLLCTKPVYGGNALATFRIGSRPRMVTVRTKVMEPAKPGPSSGNVINFEPSIDGSLVKTELVEAVPIETVSLDKANAIVAVGRGIGGVEGLKELEKVVQSLRKHFDRVEVGASRPAIDAGWLPSSRQIGLTGEKVSPQLYLAVGISGASQHISGMTGAKKTVAINKDARAPIFNYSDYGVVGNYRDVIPALAKKLEEL